jgi:acyl-CoA thioester hydrolase
VAEPFRHRMRVRYAECDPQGIVFNSRYLEYFDVALTELWRETIGPYEQAMAEMGVELVVVEARVRYLSSLRFDEVFDLVATVTRLGRTGMSTAIEVARPDGPAAAEGEIHHVFVAAGGGEKAQIPERVREALRPHAAA